MALTKQDLTAIREIVREEVRVEVRSELVVATEKFITKDEFYKTADKILGELSNIRDEVTLSASHAQVSELEERTVALEEIHPQGKHQSYA